MQCISTKSLNVKGMEIRKIILTDVIQVHEDEQHSMMILVTKQIGIYTNVIFLESGSTWGRGSRKDLRTRRWGAELCNVILWIRHGGCKRSQGICGPLQKTNSSQAKNLGRRELVTLRPHPQEGGTSLVLMPAGKEESLIFRCIGTGRFPPPALVDEASCHAQLDSNN